MNDICDEARASLAEPEVPSVHEPVPTRRFLIACHDTKGDLIWLSPDAFDSAQFIARSTDVEGVIVKVTTAAGCDFEFFADDFQAAAEEFFAVRLPETDGQR